jgi:uncharacterized membrane protein YeaQ/YmgE (transglycosylase-associated protein family)
MNIIIYLIVAAVIGWIATEIMHDRSNLLINIIVAVVGAFLAGYFSPRCSMSLRSTRATLASLRCWYRCWVPSSCWRLSTFSLIDGNHINFLMF